MKKAIRVIFTIANFIIFLPALLCCAFTMAIVEEQDKGKDKNKTLISSTYILSLLNSAVLWWLIYKVFIG